VTAKKKRSKKATFFITVQNDGTAADTFTMKGPGKKSGFSVRYLADASGTTTITTAVKNGTFALANLAPGQSRTIRLVVKVKAGARLGVLRSWLVVATSTHDGSRIDAVKAKVRVARG
jgi:hypothetical protein